MMESVGFFKLDNKKSNVKLIASNSGNSNFTDHQVIEKIAPISSRSTEEFEEF